MSEPIEVPKTKTPAQVKRDLNQKAIKAVHVFIERYMELEEGNDAEHEANEAKLIERLYDIFDPEDATPM
jgi:hypothetical protein